MARFHHRGLSIAWSALLLAMAFGACGEALPPAQAEAVGTLPPVACRYEIKLTKLTEIPQHPVTSHWLFWRTDRMIQTADGKGERGEVWERNAVGQIFYRKLYHAEKTAVEYMPADSAVDHRNVDWSRLSSLLDPKDLVRLPVLASVEFAGQAAERRSGVLDGQQADLIWLPVQGLPARLSKSDGRQTIEINLLELKPFEQASVPPAALADINRYRQLDHADFGDMESDPFVSKLVEGKPHSHAH